MNQPRKIFNPLEALSSTADVEARHTATASLYNEEVGVCPKCKTTMTRAVIANNDTVFYCQADRVSVPLPDDQCTPCV
jgi:hypothetical protein